MGLSLVLFCEMEETDIGSRSVQTRKVLMQENDLLVSIHLENRIKFKKSCIKYDPLQKRNTDNRM